MISPRLNAWAVVAILFILGGCGESNQDLKKWVKDQENLPKMVEPLPQVKPFEPFVYDRFNEPDPFKPRKLSIKQDNAGNGLAPDRNRRREPLEEFPLEQLKMVGTLNQSGVNYALVRANKTLYRVRKGMHMGQDFGLITEITENEIKLKEIVQDTAGDWSERESVIPLLEGTGGK